jgi:hypothetical protein
MENEIQPDKFYATTLQMIGAVAQLPVVRVDREAFLRKHFADSPHLNVLVANLNGDFDDELELNAEFAALLDADVIEGDVVETGPAAPHERLGRGRHRRRSEPRRV